ncbi:MAG TPA: DUF1616 domain-containing protein [Solirubrobacterales bacterium]
MNSRRDALIVATYALVAAAVLLLDPPALLAGIVGAPLVLLAPGLALVTALDIDGESGFPMRRLILSIAISVAVTALGGILVNIVAPLDRASWTIWSVAFTCSCCAVAIWRVDEPGAAPLAAAIEWLPGRGGEEGGRRWAGIAVVVCLILACAATLTQITSSNAYDSPLIELGARPVSGPRGEVEISVANKTDHAERLRLTYREDTVPYPHEDIEVPASGSFSEFLAVGPSGVTVVLTRPGDPRALGTLILTEGAPGSESGGLVAGGAVAPTGHAHRHK